IPLLHGAWMRATHPLAHAVLGRIVRDEAAHGIAGWSFLDWALPQLDADGHPLGWLGSHAYLSLAERSLRARVVVPFAARGIDVSAAAQGENISSADTATTLSEDERRLEEQRSTPTSGVKQLFE